MYVTGGFNAYPAEIESMLRRCPGVAQVAVVGLADERMGEVGCAVIVRERGDGDDVTFAESVIAYARGAMANYKVPRTVEIVDVLPTNASGKVLKRELRDRFGS